LKKIYPVIAAVLFAFFAHAAYAENFSSVVGKWKTKDDDTGKFKSIVEFYVAKDGTLEGRIIKILDKDKAPVCESCPGESDYGKGTPLEGMVIAKGIQKLGEKSGTIFDPAKAKNYKVEIRRDGKNLLVRGYVAFFYRTQVWYPAD
jgi:uncharacterized protein (DUF2147 family)